MIGVVLLNMGGPDDLSAVRPFLYNLFSDREIIQLGPPWLQRPLARLISWVRAPKSRECYRKIGGRSPILHLTRLQAQALARLAREREGREWVVEPGMRYWAPRTPEVLEGMVRRGVRRVVGIPLYPHFSRATSGSSIAEFQEACMALGLEHEVVEGYPDHPLYLASLLEGLGAAFDAAGFPRWEIPPHGALIYSAHSLPRRFVEEGDPYVDQIRATIRGMEELTSVEGELCFQSRSGPVEWLEPATDHLLDELASRGKRRIVVVPISFVSDHVETLYEIDILYRGQVEARGARLFRARVPNDSPRFIEALYDLAVMAMERAGWLG